MYYFVYCLYCLFPIIVTWTLWSTVTYKTLKNKTLSSSKRDSKASFTWPCSCYILSPSSYTFACINLITYTLNTLRIGFMIVDLLSPVVFSYCTSLPSYMMLIYGLRFRVESLVFHLLWCELTVVRFDDVVWVRLGMVETVKSVRWCGCWNLLRTES
jgi:hypothetical protein